MLAHLLYQALYVPRHPVDNLFGNAGQQAMQQWSSTTNCMASPCPYCIQHCQQQAQLLQKRVTKSDMPQGMLASCVLQAVP